jgi:SAM-dependent methyltransferase
LIAVGDTYRQFAGTIPETYERYLGPLMFAPYADDLVARVPMRPGVRILELACGTGIVTRRLVAALPPDGHLVATDLNADMIAVARAHVPADPRVEWHPADACALPFGDGAFDVVICQFGLMFFPDKPAAMREVARVLAPGGRCIVSTWGTIAENEHIRGLVAALGNDTAFFDVPYGMHDPVALAALFTSAGLRDVEVRPVAFVGLSPSPFDAARGLLCGTPAYHALLQRGANIDGLIRVAGTALGEAYGHAPMRVRMRALVVTGRRESRGRGA